jgi:hypothetical protein
MGRRSKCRIKRSPFDPRRRATPTAATSASAPSRSVKLKAFSQNEALIEDRLSARDGNSWSSGDLLRMLVRLPGLARIPSVRALQPLS